MMMAMIESRVKSTVIWHKLTSPYMSFCLQNYNNFLLHLQSHHKKKIYTLTSRDFFFHFYEKKNFFFFCDEERLEVLFFISITSSLYYRIFFLLSIYMCLRMNKSLFIKKKKKKKKNIWIDFHPPLRALRSIDMFFCHLFASMEQLWKEDIFGIYTTMLSLALMTFEFRHTHILPIAYYHDFSK